LLCTNISQFTFGSYKRSMHGSTSFDKVTLSQPEPVLEFSIGEVRAGGRWWEAWKRGHGPLL